MAADETCPTCGAGNGEPLFVSESLNSHDAAETNIDAIRSAVEGNAPIVVVP